MRSKTLKLPTATHKAFLQHKYLQFRGAPAEGSQAGETCSQTPPVVESVTDSLTPPVVENRTVHSTESSAPPAGAEEEGHSETADTENINIRYRDINVCENKIAAFKG